MPELPEVEVTRMGLAPHLNGRSVTAVTLRRSGLRWPFPANLPELLIGQTVRSTGRRGKYLLIEFDHGTLIVHLGMSGTLRMMTTITSPEKHDHFDLVLGNAVMRMNDPRRFGAVLWHPQHDGAVDQHLLLRGLGVEPLLATSLAELLHARTRGRTAAIKQVLLAGDVVVGVGNIYASESLFRAGIHPKTQAGRIALGRYHRLASEIKLTLAAAIAQGGSTLRDFVGANGQSGYFQQSYFVYDRLDEACLRCGTPIRQITQGQRSTFFCVRCQK